jgi:hypothetical protein
MSDNVFDIGSHRPLESLIKELGGLDECRRLGFVFEDENKIMSLSTAGLGYLLFVKARDITDVAKRSPQAISAQPKNTKRNSTRCNRRLSVPSRCMF